MSDKIAMNIKAVEKRNQLFANALTLNIIGVENFKAILKKDGYDKKYIEEFTQVIEKFLKDYRENLQKVLIHLD